MSLSRRAFLSQSGRAIAGGTMVLAVPEMLHSALDPGGAYLERSVYAMGTTVSITAAGHDRKQVLAATSAAFDELYRLDRLLSVYRKESDIGRINALAGGYPLKVHRDTYEILSHAKRFHGLSRGGFDVTIEPLMRRWGFRDDAPHPEGSEIVTGDGHLHLLRDMSVRIDHPDVRVDTGGIAVGFAVDRMVLILRSYGIETALVNHGGDIYALGAPEGSDGWSVIIPHPHHDDEELLVLRLKDRALSTSTNVRNVRHAEGRTIGHIFDPSSRKNPEANLSMTVLAQTSCEADALSTACFVSSDARALKDSGCDYVALTSGERLETSLR